MPGTYFRYVPKWNGDCQVHHVSLSFRPRNTELRTRDGLSEISYLEFSKKNLLIIKYVF